jgi:hypothetical protein
VTRLRDGTSLFLGKPKIVRLIEARIAVLEREDAALTAPCVLRIGVDSARARAYDCVAAQHIPRRGD